MARVVCVGEGMLELSREGDGWQLGYGGDTLSPQERRELEALLGETRRALRKAS